jgi:hypothetical protein
MLHKTCAAQEIGPTGAYLVTIIAHQEDSCRYRRPVTFYDSQLMPILGVTSQETLTTARRKAVAAGWLSYSPGHKGRASTYFVCVPSHVSGLEDGTIDEGTDLDSSALRSEMSTESRSNPDRKPIESRSKADSKVPPFNPSPTATPVPKENIPPQEATDGTENVDASMPDSDGFAVAHGIDWLTVESEFAKAWNATPNTSKCRSGIAHDLAGKFRESWLTPGWKEDAVIAMAKIPDSTLGAISLRQFLTPSFFESLLGGTYGPKPPRGKPVEKPTTGTVPAKPPKTALDRITFEMLPNPKAMVRWWQEAAAEGLCESTEVERLNIVGAGVRARMGDVRDGVKWFVACVRERAWDRIGDEADEIARIRLKELDHGGPERPRGEQIAEILNKLRGVAVAADVPDNPEVEHAD